MHTPSQHHRVHSITGVAVDLLPQHLHVKWSLSTPFLFGTGDAGLWHFWAGCVLLERRLPALSGSQSHQKSGVFPATILLSWVSFRSQDQIPLHKCSLQAFINQNFFVMPACVRWESSSRSMQGSHTLFCEAHSSVFTLSFCKSVPQQTWIQAIFVLWRPPDIWMTSRQTNVINIISLSCGLSSSSHLK